MAGHSKWANIQHRKGVQDAKRGKLFTRCIREITTAARRGDPDPANNPRLRMAIDKALTANMTKDTIERAIKRGSGEDGGAAIDEIRYEGYGPGGVAIIVDCMTDNRTRTVGEVRHAFTKHGGNLGADGSVSYLFNKCGVLSFPSNVGEDKVMEVALEAGAEDVINDGGIEVLTDPSAFLKVKESMEKAGLKPEASEITLRASISVTVEGENAESVMELLEALENLDDVQTVYSNADFPDEVLRALAGVSRQVTRILGIDPGSISTGYGIVDSEGQSLKYVDCGNIRTSSGNFLARLEEIYFGIGAIVERYAPDEVAVERGFVHKNADSALKLGQARAAAVCGTLVKRVPLHEYTPKEVKQAVVGKGGADKEQVQHMMRVLLGLKGALQADSADALAVAICHAHSRGLRRNWPRWYGPGSTAMIGFLRGKLLRKQPPHLVIDVHGVGYEVEAPMSTFYDLPETGAELTLFTHLTVREDAHILFGFGSEAERRFFRSLIRVNGVGPKLALTILSGISLDAFVRCVQENDPVSLTRLPGIGKKTAERLVVEMRDRLDDVGAPDASGLSAHPRDEALSALVSLGYKPQEASHMLRGVKEDGLTSEELIRRALQGALRTG